MELGCGWVIVLDSIYSELDHPVEVQVGCKNPGVLVKFGILVKAQAKAKGFE